MDDDQVNALVEHARAQMVEISNLFHGMPFGGICEFRYWNPHPRQVADVFDLDDVIHNLKSLRDVLERHVTDQEALERELSRYKSAVGGLKLLTELMNDA